MTFRYRAAEQRPEGRNLGMAFCGQGVFLGIVIAGSSCQHIEKLWFISEECHEQAVERWLPSM